MNQHGTGTWIEIDATALEHNLKELQTLLAPSRLCMVIKANAYGHGYASVLPAAQRAGVRDFAVFSAREARGALPHLGPGSRLQVMGYAEPDNIPWMLESGLEPWLNGAQDWQHFKKHVKGPARVHLELETGMNRSGLQPDVALKIAREIAEHEYVTLAGVCTHLAGAEDPQNDARIAHQMGRFEDFNNQLKDAGITGYTQHVASSSAGILNPAARFDMVRMGIACYGLWPSPHVRANGPDLDLRNVLSWKSRVLALRRVKDGDNVGYGTSYEAEGDTTIAVVAVGYGDGLSRALSNLGYVLVHGRRATIVGPVNMNMIQVNVGHIPDVSVGDEVVLIGCQGDRQISVASFSEYNQIVNYELMARLSWEVPRVVLSPKQPGPSFGEDALP